MPDHDHAANDNRANAFPYLRSAPEGVCELCHRVDDVLTEVVVDPRRKITYALAPGWDRTGLRLARAVWACGRHAGGNGGPPATPSTTTLRGTTALRPQEERLFDQIPYRRAGEAERRWTA